MSTDGPDADDRLLERLRQSASGDAAVRQLRRRYDLLRNDYELLIDRLGELEDRLAAAPPSPEQSTPLRLPASAPQAEAEPKPEPAGPAMRQDLIAPLLRLRDEYLAAVSGIQEIASGLDRVTAAAFKGQHRSTPAPLDEDDFHAERPHLKQPRVEVGVKGSSFGQLLDFQEQLSAVPGVARVSINAIDNERANLVVELETGPNPGRDA